jgi:hypothetical protein
MAEGGAVRSGPCSLSYKMSHSAMTIEGHTEFTQMRVRVAPGIVRIRRIVEDNGKSG